MASVFRQMLVMVKTVEARSTSKTNQRDSHAVPEMPACILKFQVSFTTQVKRRNLSFQMFKQSFQINEFRTNAISHASVYKAYQAKVHPKPESRLSPILPVFLVRSWCLYLSIYVCVSVSPLVDIKACRSLQVVHANYDFHSLIRKLSRNSYGQLHL